MYTLKQVRMLLGISQKTLAIYLDVSTSLLAMAEKGNRILPTTALLKLNDLQLRMLPNKSLAKHSSIIPHIQKHQATYTKQLQQQHKALQYQIKLQQKKLETLQIQHQQALAALGLAANQPQKLKKIKDKDHAWWQVLELTAAATLKKTHPLIQATLQIKINSLQQEATALKKLWKKNVF
jgi:transcriptional regulator with XRE-family HTH domain